LKVWVEKGRNFKTWNTNPQSEKFFISLAAFGQKFKTNSKSIA
jgi:hypothetical protein